MRITVLARLNRFQCTTLTALLLVAAPPALAQTLSDQIFAASAEQQLVIEGKIGYPMPLAGAIVEAHIGSYVATGSSRADGTYTLGIELSHLPVGGIIELIGFGTGTNAQQVWASPIGPSDRLRGLANAEGRVNGSIDPFVNLNPRTTAIAGAIRAYGGFLPIATEAAYYRAARSYQDVAENLTFALALVARGGLALPASAPNYFAAVNSTAAMQQLYAGMYSAYVDCTVSPASLYCQVVNGLPVSSDIVPTAPVVNSIIYAPYSGYDNISHSTQPYEFIGVSAARIYNEAGAATTTNISDAGNGILRLKKPDGSPISEYSYTDYSYNPPVQASRQTMALKIRPSVGPAGQLEHGLGAELRTIWPNNPEIPPVSFDYMSLPRHVSGDTMPAVLTSATPSRAGKRFLLPLGQLQSGADPNWSGRFGYDMHQFSTVVGGQAERAALSFTYTETAGGFQLLYSSFSADVRFVNEEEPGVWRIRSHIIGGGVDTVLTGLMLEATGARPYSSSNTAGQIRFEINGYVCAGPLGRVTMLASYTDCYDGNGFLLTAGNAVIRMPEMATFGTWTLPLGANAGRLLVDRYSGANVTQRRGWERIRQTGTSQWMLENVNNPVSGVPGVAAVSFGPSSRLVRVTLP